MVSVVIPARDEADLVGKTVAAALGLEPVTEVVVVDDGSLDATARVAGQSGARVLRQPRRGKGAALAAGVAAAGGEVLLFLDGDLGPSARLAGALIEPVLAGRAEMAVALLPPAGRRGGFGLVQACARLGVRALTGRSVGAPLCGQRCLRRTVWELAQPVPRGYGVDVALTVEAIRRGFTVEEVPLAMTHRFRGRALSGLLHRARQGYQVLAALAGCAARRCRAPGAPAGRRSGRTGP